MAKRLNPTITKSDPQAEAPQAEQGRVPTKSSMEAASAGNSEMLFGHQNYRLMLIGIALVVVGFALMIGGSMPDANTWDENLIYSFTRITLSPIVILVGLCIEVYAIFFDNKLIVEEVSL